MNVLKQSAEALENRLLKTGRVLETRAWSPAGFVEIDLHLPGCDMSGWDETKHIKCRVAPFTYRDYTPAGWDEETQTCTLYIETTHDGPGSHWASRLKKDDPIAYLGVANSHHRVEKGKWLVLLGDETAIGHFFSLSALAGDGVPIGGALSILKKDHQHQFVEYFPGFHLEVLDKRNAQDYASLLNWADSSVPDNGDAFGLDDTIVSGDTTAPGDTKVRIAAAREPLFLLAGYVPAMGKLRKLLRRKGYRPEQVRAQGFWD